MPAKKQAVGAAEAVFTKSKSSISVVKYRPIAGMARSYTQL